MDFWRAAGIIEKRKWLIILSTVVCALLTFGATRLTGSKYQATYRYLWSRNSAALNSQGDARSNDPWVLDSEVKSQAQIYDAVVKSGDMIHQAMIQMGQTEIPANILDNISVTNSSPRTFELKVTDSNYARAQDLANFDCRRPEFLHRQAKVLGGGGRGIPLGVPDPAPVKRKKAAHAHPVRGDPDAVAPEARDDLAITTPPCG